jgi:cobalt-zinc-cadmium efflux system membrane fusion protein
MNTSLDARQRDQAEISTWPLACTVLSACTGSQSRPKAEAPNDNGEQSAAAIVRHAGAASMPSASPLRKLLQVAATEQHAVERPILVPGVVEADPARLIKVVSPVSRRIVKKSKMHGDAAKRGSPLFEIDSANLARATSEAIKARAAVTIPRQSRGHS